MFCHFLETITSLNIGKSILVPKFRVRMNTNGNAFSLFPITLTICILKQKCWFLNNALVSYRSIRLIYGLSFNKENKRLQIKNNIDGKIEKQKHTHI